jgi:ABC-type transport system substrate-binding protein
LDYLAGLNMFIVPKEAVDYYGEDFKLHPVGTGPFRFSEIVPNKKLILVKNENYWGVEDHVRLPYLDAVEYVLYLPGESEKMLLDFQTGKIEECTEEVAKHLSDLVELDASGAPVFKGWLKENGVQYVKDKLFRKLRYIQADGKDRKVRQAMSFAINRERLLESKSDVFQNYKVARGPIPPNCQYFKEQLDGQFYDPDKARALLKEAGHPGGVGLPVYLFLSPPGKERDLIVEDLQAVGFRVQKSDFFPKWREYLIAPERSLLLLNMTNINTGVEPQDVFEMFLWQPYCTMDSAFVAAYEAWQKSDVSMKNKTLINRLEEIIADITPVIFLYHIDGEFRLLQRYVRGRQLGNAWGHKLHYVWLDHESGT